MRHACSIFACADHVLVSMFNWSMDSVLASRIDEEGEMPIEIPFVPRSRCYGTVVSDATSTFLIVIRITGTMRSTSLNSDAVRI